MKDFWRNEVCVLLSFSLAHFLKCEPIVEVVCIVFDLLYIRPTGYILRENPPFLVKQIHEIIAPVNDRRFSAFTSLCRPGAKFI